MKQVTRGLVGLAVRRKSAGYTQETFAAALGVKRSLLAAWEVGRVWPSSRLLPQIAELLSCPVEDLYSVPPDASPDTVSQEGG